MLILILNIARRLFSYSQAMYRGFESLTLRHFYSNLVNRGFFISSILCHGHNKAIDITGGSSNDKKILSVNINDKNEYFINSCNYDQYLNKINDPFPTPVLVNSKKYFYLPIGRKITC